jgi:hypothetical protein
MRDRKYPIAIGDQSEKIVGFSLKLPALTVMCLAVVATPRMTTPSILALKH